LSLTGPRLAAARSRRRLPGAFLVVAVAFTPAQTPSRVWFGAIGAGALVGLVVTSVWRQRLRLSDEVWQILHAVRHVYMTRIALVTTVLLVLACLAFAAIQN
jgi:hypothetical protein